ncbi:MAG TPA: hypothetical protein VIC57_16755 [Candidatus Dormibacteraeota bacterium]|jgi:hypothetical protein
MFARRCADGAVTVLVYVSAGAAVVLLPLLGFGTGGGRRQGGGLLGLVLLAAVFAGALLAESGLITGELPRLLRGGGL